MAYKLSSDAPICSSINSCSAGVYANYNISGDASEVTFDLSIDLCVATFVLTTCASSLGIPDMPVTLINGTYDFSTLCA